MFKRQPTDTQFLFITALLVLLLAFPTFHTLTKNEVEEVTAEQITRVDGVAEGSRAPASVPGKVPTVKLKPVLSQFTQYDLSCAKKGLSELKVSGSYVQFQGKNCLKNFKVSDIEIINKSNGYTASIFGSGTDKYQTDLIQLQKGDNEITIRYRERSGKAVEEVVRILSSQI